MQQWYACLLICFLGLASCANRKLSSSVTSTSQNFEWQGHRGCRGLMPENTIGAFVEALKYPVTTLEMDVVLSGDNEVIVSHEPWMNPQICTGPGLDDGISLDHAPNLFHLSVDEIRKYDCGSKGHPKFPRQHAASAQKPTLSEVVSAVRALCSEEGREMPLFNIEIKSRKKWYDVYVPQPEVFVSRVLQEIKALDIGNRTTLQSFDINVLRELHAHDLKDIRISYLVDTELRLRHALKKLGFNPDIYSPNYRLVSRKTVTNAHRLGIRVVPWTVNSVEHMRKLINQGVDGIITDYPDLIGRVQWVE